MMKLKNGCMNVVEDKKSEKAFVLEVCMKNKLNVIVVVLLIVLGFASCTSHMNQSESDEIYAEKIKFQNNIEEILDELGFQGHFSVTVIFQKDFVRRDNVLSDSRKVKRIYGKEVDMVSLDTNETFNIRTISTPNVSSHKGIDGFYEESEYIANYTGEKPKTSSYPQAGYFSSIVVVDFYDEDLINRLNVLLNFSMANSNRNDIINVISRKDFETHKDLKELPHF